MRAGIRRVATVAVTTALSAAAIAGIAAGTATITATEHYNSVTPAAVTADWPWNKHPNPEAPTAGLAKIWAQPDNEHYNWIGWL
jgi:hypothetical protein